MNKNSNLHSAKSAKNDEFYTRLTDIEKECVNYTEHFEGKRIYCNCDDYRFSNFWKFFVEHFKQYNLKRLTATNYDIVNGAYVAEYDGYEVSIERLKGNGDFRSDEVVELLKESDIVVSNPPFSLFRDYVKQLMDYNKKFLIIGNNNAITYKEIFPYIKNNQLWLGVSPRSMCFVRPNGSINQVNANWFTNLTHNKRNEVLELTKKYSNECYPKYDNYLGFECSKVVDIPMDDYIEIEIDEKDYPKWKEVYGDDVEIITTEQKIR